MQTHLFMNVSFHKASDDIIVTSLSTCTENEYSPTGDTDKWRGSYTTLHTERQMQKGSTKPDFRDSGEASGRHRVLAEI